MVIMRIIATILITGVFALIVIMNILPGHFEHSCCGVGVFYVTHDVRPGCITFCNPNSRPTLMDNVIVFSSVFHLNK
jgi:hypothetical protein